MVNTTVTVFAHLALVKPQRYIVKPPLNLHVCVTLPFFVNLSNLAPHGRGAPGAGKVGSPGGRTLGRAFAWSIEDDAILNGDHGI